MWPSTEQISYRLKNGTIINYIFDADKGLTLEDINNVANMCLEAFQNPNKVFIREDLYYRLFKDLTSQMRYTPGQPLGIKAVSFMLGCGSVTPVPVSNSYIPFLVGDDEDFADNDFYKVFEEAVNG